MINTAKDGDEAVELVHMVNGFSASIEKEREVRRARLDSDAILVRKSVEVSGDGCFDEGGKYCGYHSSS